VTPNCPKRCPVRAIGGHEGSARTADGSANGRAEPVSPQLSADIARPGGRLPQNLVDGVFNGRRSPNHAWLAVPAAAMDVYSDFFSRHDLTYFCHISALKPFVSCPYSDQLSLVMERAYNLGNFNASLFATEGIASVGLLFAPLATFACGLVIALGNGLSAGLPGRFVLISGAVFPQILLNVPLSVASVSHGLAILFLLWYITPRAIFEQDGAAPT